jgi:hypothetical protein
MSLKRRHYAGTFGGARQEALLKLVTALLAMICGINDLFDCTNVLEVLGDTYLQKEIHSLLKMRELALALWSKGAVTFDAWLKRSLRQSERSRWQQNEGRGSNVGVIMMIFLILASLLSVVLLFAILAVARWPTSLLLLLPLLVLLLLLLLLSLALLLVELGIFSLVLDRGNTVGILCVASIAAA